MDDTTKNCPKCKSEMHQGFIPDFICMGASVVSGWFEGEPLKSLWRGTMAVPMQGLPILAFRGLGCGYLDFYADKNFDIQ